MIYDIQVFEFLGEPPLNDIPAVTDTGIGLEIFQARVKVWHADRTGIVSEVAAIRPQSDCS
jgi:hypothetical protein